MKKLNAAIIGAGFIGEAHIEAIRRLGYVDVVAIAQSSKEKAEARAAALGIAHAYGDYRAILEDSSIDVIHNCTPNHLHYQLNKEILHSGKHLLSEKPLTMTSEEAKQLAALAEQTGLVCGVNHNYRLYPMVQQMKAMVQAGDLGKIHLVRGEYLQDWLLFATDYNWRLEPQYGGKTRAIGDIGSHLYDLAQYVIGSCIVEVFADLATFLPKRKKPRQAQITFRQNQQETEEVDVHSEDYGTVIARFENGARGVFTVSQMTAGKKNGLALHLDGAKASASWHQEEPFKLSLGYRDRPNEILLRDASLVRKEAVPYIHYPGGHEEAWADGMKNMMQQFYGSIRSGQQLPHAVASFREGYRIMLIIDAIVASARSGQWVKIDDID